MFIVGGAGIAKMVSSWGAGRLEREADRLRAAANAVEADKRIKWAKILRVAASFSLGVYIGAFVSGAVESFVGHDINLLQKPTTPSTPVPSTPTSPTPTQPVTQPSAPPPSGGSDLAGLQHGNWLDVNPLGWDPSKLGWATNSPNADLWVGAGNQKWFEVNRSLWTYLQNAGYKQANLMGQAKGELFSKALRLMFKNGIDAAAAVARVGL